MLQKIGAIALASALVVSTSVGALAAGTDHAALAPGKPAGVKNAMMRAPLWVWVAGVGFVALGIGLVASGNGNGTSSGSTTNTNVF